jgi:hypothetical protein
MTDRRPSALRRLSWGLVGTRPINLYRLLPRKRHRELARIAREVAERHGPMVGMGPFAGMRFERGSPPSGYVHRLIGSYEAELHGVVEQFVAAGYRTVANIGAGDGYYAVGLALRMPAARVHAFEALPSARKLCAELAEANGVADRVTVHRSCTPERLREVLAPGSLVLCDCEGCELKTMVPGDVPVLTECDLIVELHDFLDPSITPTLSERFSPTHDIEFIDRVTRFGSMYEFDLGLSDADRDAVARAFAAEENLSVQFVEAPPPPQQWAVMRSRSG